MRDNTTKESTSCNACIQVRDHEEHGAVSREVAGVMDYGAWKAGSTKQGARRVLLAQHCARDGGVIRQQRLQLQKQLGIT